MGFYGEARSDETDGSQTNWLSNINNFRRPIKNIIPKKPATFRSQVLQTFLVNFGGLNVIIYYYTRKVRIPTEQSLAIIKITLHIMHRSNCSTVIPPPSGGTDQKRCDKLWPVDQKNSKVTKLYFLDKCMKLCIKKNTKQCISNKLDTYLTINTVILVNFLS